MVRFCSIEDCDRQVHARGWCRRHYRSWQEHGDPLAAVSRNRPDRIENCSIEGCPERHDARGLCQTHYYRWKRYDDPLGGGPVRHVGDEEARFWQKVDTSGDCWEWTASGNGLGYGRFLDKSGRRIYAHRFAYELLVGPIPQGLHLDHLCGNPPCVNPDHLEPVTQAENNRRARKAKP